ncbi:MAG: hypothetical protein ACD_79C00551G0002 [uncultured bacterium]|nr:MAG: hypothetical protein ACD_79C00551G0002 [uncultured bacterium]
MKMIIFAHGYDVPGIGAAITKILFEQNCNIDDFKIISSDNFFTLMVSVICTKYMDKSEMEEKIKEAVSPFDVDIKVSSLSDKAKINIKEKEDWIPYNVSIICANQTQVLCYFMNEMSKMQINVSDVRCIRLSAPPDTSYKINVQIEIPIHISYEMLKSCLEDLKTDLNVMFDINPVDSLEL